MGGGGQNTVQTTTQEMSPEQRKLLEPVIPIAKEFLAKPPVQYPGTSIAGFDPLQTAAQQMTLGAAQQMLPFTQQIPQQLQSLYGGMGQSMQGTTAGMNQSFGDIAGSANNTSQQVMQQMQQSGQQMAPGMQFLTSGQALDPNSNVALRSATEAAVRPFIENFQTSILPGIASDAITAGGYGGTRQGIAEGLAAKALMQQTGDITANMANSAYGQGLNAMTQGLGIGQQQNATNLQGILGAGGLQNQAANQIMQGILSGGQFQQQAMGGMAGLLGNSGNILQQMLQPAQMTAAVGEQNQAMQQAQLSEQVQRFINEQLIPFSAAQDVASMAFGIPGGTSTSKATTSGGGAGGMQFLQAGLGALGALPMLFSLFSDKRLKTDIRPAGKLLDGLNVYRYRMLGSAKETVGLMAEEVKKLYPFAVVKDKSGYDRVIYGLVPSWR